MNNIESIEGLEKCESLEKLDLTMNFIPQSELYQLEQLAVNHNLRELFLTGNPCTEFKFYRLYVIITLPQLIYLDGMVITEEESMRAKAVASQIAEKLLHVNKHGIPKQLGIDEVMRLNPDERPWCAATRILDSEVLTKRPKDPAETSKTTTLTDASTFEALPVELADIRQKNEGDFTFKLTDSEDDTAIQLEIVVGTFIDVSLINIDIQPRVVRVKIKDQLLQLKLSQDVATDTSYAERSKATGKLLITMPKLDWHVKPRARKLNHAIKGDEDDIKVEYLFSECDDPPSISY